MRKRICSLLLVMVMLISLFPGLDLRAEAVYIWYKERSSVAGSDYTKNSELAKKLDSIFDGNANIYSNKACTDLVNARIGTSNLKDNGVLMYVGPYKGPAINIGTSCWIYANGVYYTLFGECTGNGSPGKNSISLNLSTTSNKQTTYENFKAWGVRQGVGALVRSSTHSMIVLNYDKDTLTTLEGNGDNNGLVGIRIRSWDQLNYTVSFIIQPNEAYYNSLYPSCNHSYNNVGICTECKGAYDFMSSKDASAAGKYKITLDGGVRPRTDKPYAASEKKASNIEKGTTVQVEYSVKNHYNHVWYYVSYNGIKGYVSADNMSFVGYLDQQIGCTITSPAENATVPKKAYPLIGTITSRYPIAIINGYLDGQHFVDMKPNTTSVDLRSSVINTRLDFGALSPGKHTLELKAHDIYRTEDVTIIKRTFYTETPAPASFNVTFNANGGRCETSKLSVTDGSAIGTLPTPTLEGYTFDGWYTEPYGGTQVTSSTKVTGETTYYAHWKHAGHKIEFDYEGAPRSDAAVTAQANGVNIGRAGAYLVVYNDWETTVDTNIYGCEIAVDSTGLVVGVREYGDTNQLTVPYGGFVLSGQHGWHEGATEAYGGYVDVKKIINMGSGARYVYFDYETGKVYAYTNHADYIASHKYVVDGENYGIMPVPEQNDAYFGSWFIIENDSFIGVGFNTEYCGNQLVAGWSSRQNIGHVASMEYNGHRYEYYQYHVSWQEAKAICEEKGGHLVTITSAEEQAQVTGLASRLYEAMYFIGCTDEGTEGNWRWVTGEPFVYSNWDIDSDTVEPNGGTWENYGILIAKENLPRKQVGEWNDGAAMYYGYSYDPYYDISNTGFICEYDSVPCAHTYKFEVTTEPTMNSTGEYYSVCELCGEAFYTVLPILNANDYRYSCAEEPTCDMIGWDAYYWTDKNGADFAFDIFPPATGHAMITLNVKAATCNEDGYTGDEACETCGKIIIEGKKIPATGHTWDTGKITKEPTETEEGLKLYTCTVCGKTKEEVIPKLIHVHDYSENVIVPTCTEQGYTLYTCSCGDSYKDKYIDAVDHDTELKNAKEATCTAEGYTGDEVCVNCGKVIKNGDVVAVKEHTWDDGKVTKEATEEADGVKLYTCTACGVTKEEVIPKLSHTHNYTDTVVDPTCTEQGYTLYECACGDNYRDNYVDAVGHATKIENTKEATCIEEGYTGDEVCVNCGKVIKNGDVIKTKEHTWDDGKVIKEATEEADGLKLYTCTACGVTKEEVIPKLSHTHNYTDTVVDPTCTDAGYTEYVCNCGESYREDYVNATGHSFSKGKCTVCGATDPDYVEPNPTPIDNPFVDVKSSDYFYDPVLWAVSNGVTGGTSATTFSPNAPCTRGQVVTFLWAASGRPEPKSSMNPFSDVKESDYYYKAVLWAVENGITGGIGNGMFGPNQPCTRAQVATFLWKSQGGEIVQSANGFADVAASAYYYNAVLWAVENEVTGGVGNGCFGPDQTCTRGQIATFLYKALN